MKYYGEYAYAPASAFEASDDVLPDVLAAVKTDLGNNPQSIVKVLIKSASSFTVKLSGDTKLLAESLGASSYAVEYEGVIDRMIFSADTTATYVRVAY